VAEDEQPGSAVAVEDEGSGVVVPFFGYQLVDVYLLTCSVEREQVEGDRDRQPSFETSLSTDVAEPEGGFTAYLNVKVRVRYREEADALVEVVVVGVYLGHAPLDAAVEKLFRERECAVAIWPFARSMVAELGRMMNIGLPPLPLVDVRAFLGPVPDPA
jgi:preprotein translocase subunit SecB